MRRWLVATVMALQAVAISDGAMAQSFRLSDQEVSEIIQRMMSNIDRLRCSADRLCQPATAAEKADPPVSIVEGRAAITRGVVSGFGRFCGLEWQRSSFAPMMAAYRAQGKSERQAALYSSLHGYGMSMTETTLEGQVCPDKLRANISRQLPFNR